MRSQLFFAPIFITLSVILISPITTKPLRTVEAQPESTGFSVSVAQTGDTTIGVPIRWERNREEDTINGGSVGAGVNAGIQLPTSPENVWDSGTYTPEINKRAIPSGFQWASWQQKFAVDIRRFKGTFTLPDGVDPSSAVGVLYDPYYNPDAIPINDNLYIYLNGVRKFFGGTNYGTANLGFNGTAPLANETDGWIIRNGVLLSGFQTGTNTLDIITEERNGWGGLGLLSLRFGPRLADSDNDGLPDVWETNGVTIDSGDGSGPHFIDLKAMGADPNKPDVFVHADWMKGRKPTLEAFKIVQDAFSNAPTPINLHIDAGPDSIMIYGSNESSTIKWGVYSRAGEREFRENLGTINETDYDWNEFNTHYKTRYFIPTGRAPIFHYALFASKIGKGFTSPSGVASPAPASDFIVSLGSFNALFGISFTRQQAGTFMHELGHNFGLEHGGADDIRFKPNYLSIMNYAFQFKGLSKNGTSGGIYDYSHAELPLLDERNLDERKGLKGDTDGTASEGFATIHYCPRKVIDFRTSYYDAVYPANGSIDWNCSETIDDTPVAAHIIGPDGNCPPSEERCTKLRGFDDWSHVITHLKRGAIGQAGVTPFLASSSDVEELTPELVTQVLGGHRINLPLVTR